MTLWHKNKKKWKQKGQEREKEIQKNERRKKIVVEGINQKRVKLSSLHLAYNI